MAAVRRRRRAGPAAGASSGAASTPLQHSGRSPATVWPTGTAFSATSSLGSSAHPLRRALLRIQHTAGGGGLPR
jgi:hypothetical protein